MPFDRCLSTPEMVTHCLQTKFEDFLNKDNFKQDDKEKGTHHTTYDKMNTEFHGPTYTRTFPHENLTC